MRLGLTASIIALAMGMISKTGLSLNRLRSAPLKHQSQSDQMTSTCRRRAGCSDSKSTEHSLDEAASSCCLIDRSTQLVSANAKGIGIGRDVSTPSKKISA